MSSAYRLARRALFKLDPERAHRLAVRALASGWLPRHRIDPDPRLKRSLLGHDFPNPIGIAAGFDKDGEAIEGLFGLGFGYVEVGTVTPRPQDGNPRPRLFRLPGDRALINRLGFNNRGHDALYRKLVAREQDGGIVGVNIGANRDSTDRIEDYVRGVERFANIASYLTVNISSPNTPGLRDLQEKTALVDLLGRVVAARDASARRPPLLLKIAPDLDDAALEAIVEAAVAAAIEGMIITNTTTARDRVRDPQASETGGLSGWPLMRRSNVVLAKVRKLSGARLVLIGAGGVHSPETAFVKMAAGADLVQLYTGLVFEGPGLPVRILAGLLRLMERQGLARIADLVGSDVERWAKARI
jgi:dihydroorotate dehydrogenase